MKYILFNEQIYYHYYSWNKRYLVIITQKYNNDIIKSLGIVLRRTSYKRVFNEFTIFLITISLPDLETLRIYLTLVMKYDNTKISPSIFNRNLSLRCLMFALVVFVSSLRY